MRNAITEGYNTNFYFIEINKGEFVSTNRPARDEHDRNQVKQKYEQVEVQRQRGELTAPEKTKKRGGYPEQKIQKEENEQGVKIREEITFRPFKVNEAYLKKRKAKFYEIEKPKKQNKKEE